MDEKCQGQLIATDTELLDILRLCLTEDTIIVIDGIDECTDSETFVQSLVNLSHSTPNIRQLLLSRVNVSALKRAVLSQQIFSMAKTKIDRDIHRFLLDKLEDMIDEQLLQTTSVDQKASLADRLCKGADGMFLWARLMVRCLRSPYLTRQYRLRMIKQVNLPEGLENMYERIVTVIHDSGSSATGLASKALTWLAFSVVPMTTRQLRQAFTAQDGSESPLSDEDISEFQDCVIMACAGLVERSTIDSNPECPKGEPTLRFIHLSLQELIVRQSDVTKGPIPSHVGLYRFINEASRSEPQASSERHEVDGPHLRNLEPYQLHGPSNSRSVFQPLVPKPILANLVLAACCLQQLLYHTPAQPLGGGFNKRVSEHDLNREQCFTSYAAVHWIYHLQRYLELVDSAISPPDSVVIDFIKLLSIFMAKPRVLSSWLEAYYTARYHRDAVDYLHPPIYIIHDWTDRIGKSYLEEQAWMTGLVQEVRKTVHALMLDMESIVETWGSQLDKSPEIIWDEMSYYAKSSFFFSPESLKVSIQEPEPPKYPNLSKDPVAKMSKTSSSGTIKAILCIWAPR